jgi:hypothetical protein
VYLVYDAAIPPSRPYPGAHAFASYLGGNTAEPPPTAAQWNAATGNGWLRCLGIWVAITDMDPVWQADSAANAAINLGWRPNLGRYIALDRETLLNQNFVITFNARLNLRGFSTIEYRSEGSIIESPTPDQIANWMAWFGHTPDFNLAANTEMFQYAANVEFDGTHVDLSVADYSAWARFGRGLRH